MGDTASLQSAPYRSRQLWVIGAAAALVLAVGIAVFLVSRQGDEPEREAVAGLPATPDYHSLLVDPDDPDRVFLGSHGGLHETADGGVSWRQIVPLSGQDAMNLVRGKDGTLWAAGHNVLAKSEDGGASWEDVRPDGLPGLDLHGFTIDPADGRLYAALAGQGLYRSRDDGASFELVSDEVGGGVMALVVADGRILASDTASGLVVSHDGGKSWHVVLEAILAGLARNPSDPNRVLATGPGVLLSTDGGASWNQVLELEEGAGPVAWAPSDPDIAYVVGFDRVLYKTVDGGDSWHVVEGGR